MSIEHFAINKLREILNSGKVHHGVVREVGITKTVTHRDIRHIPFAFFDEEIEWTTEEPAFRVELPDGRTRTFVSSPDFQVGVGDAIKFGEKMALWEKVEGE